MTAPTLTAAQREALAWVDKAEMARPTSLDLVRGRTLRVVHNLERMGLVGRKWVHVMRPTSMDASHDVYATDLAIELHRSREIPIFYVTDAGRVALEASR